LRYTQEGRAIVRFSVAVGWRKRTRPESAQQEAEWEDKTTWYNVSVMGPRAEGLAQRLSTGLAVIVTGRLQPDIWINRDSVANLDMNLMADQIYIADRADREAGGRQEDDEEQPRRQPTNGGQRQAAPARRQERVDELEDLPFRSPRFLDEPWLYWRCP
jgi:single stranded DNA-binding protein